MNKNLYQPINGEIVDIIDESPTIKSFVVVPEKEFRFATGQFVELTLPGEGEAPFTPSSSPAVTDKMEISIMKAGRVTTLLHECDKRRHRLGEEPYVPDQDDQQRPVEGDRGSPEGQCDSVGDSPFPSQL